MTNEIRNEKRSKKNNRNEKHRLSNKAIIIIGCIVLFILCIVISLIIFFDMLYNKIYEESSPTPSQIIDTITLPPESGSVEDPEKTESPELTEYMPEDNIKFILCFGLAEFDLADTIMVAILNETDGKVDFLSIPRDTYIRYKDDDDRIKPEYWKINAYYNCYIDDQVVTTTDSASSMNLMGVCEKLLNIDMDYYIRISYDTIEKVVDSMGGIEFEVPFDMIYYDYTPGSEIEIELYKGLQVLNGDQVIEYLRFRKSNVEQYYIEDVSDISRIYRQQALIKAVIKKALTLDNISSVINIAKNNIKTNISKEELTGLISYGLTLNTEDIDFEMLHGGEKTVYGKSFYTTDSMDIREQLIGICE
ncbi:MAG: LCP family protein [Clostridia bacterium]